jgi:multimeric flavodoxin WrbA
VEPIFIIGINGSPRKTGGTVDMLEETLESVRIHEGRTKRIDLLDYKMLPYHGDYKRRPDQESLRLFDEIEKADGMVLATPVHWMGPSTLMKTFIDNLTYLEVNGTRLQGKVAGVLTHAWEDGAFTTARDLAGILNAMGCVLPPYSLNMRNKNLRRNIETVWMWTDAALLGKNMVTMAEMTRQMAPDWSYSPSRFPDEV